MAFGMFKKNNFADVIYTNGRFFTQTPDLPWVSAVACKDGRILSAGDIEQMEQLKSADTQIIDLKGQYAFPGFIDVRGTPVLKAFEERYLAIDPVWDLDTVLEATAEYAESESSEVIFGYGYTEHILTDYEDADEAHRLLDEIESERPVVLLGISGIHCWFNTAAAAMIEEAAESEGIQYVSPDYALNLLSPFDFDEIGQQVRRISEELCERGITSSFNVYSPDYLGNLYRDCLIAMEGEGMPIRQRFTDSLYVNRPVNPELILYKLSAGRDDCAEISDLIRFDFLKLDVCEDENLACFSDEALETICLLAAEKGFNIHIDALDGPSVIQVEKAFGLLREKGCGKNTLILAADKAEEDGENRWITTYPSDYLNNSVFGHCKTVREAVDQLTIQAAAIIGRTDELGSIEKGKLADFTVFEENPLDGDLRKFSRMQASMTILSGQVAYDEEEAANDEMFDLLMSMRL